MPQSLNRLGRFTYSEVKSFSTYTPLVGNGYGSAATTAWVAFAGRTTTNPQLPTMPLHGPAANFGGPFHPTTDDLLGIQALGWRLGDSLNSPARGASAAQLEAATRLGPQHIALLSVDPVEGQNNVGVMVWDIDDVIATPQQFTLTGIDGNTGQPIGAQRTGFFQCLLVSGGRYINGLSDQLIGTDLGFSFGRSSASIAGEAETRRLWANFTEQPATAGLTSILATASDPAAVISSQQEITARIANVIGQVIVSEFTDDLGQTWTVAGQRLIENRRYVELTGFRQLAG